MALLDRFRAQPRQKHPDPAVRLAFVQEIPLTDHELLTEVAREDPDARVRRAAVAKLLDPRALADIATSDGDESVRAEAAAMLRDVALEAFEGIGASRADARHRAARSARPRIDRASRGARIGAADVARGARRSPAGARRRAEQRVPRASVFSQGPLPGSRRAGTD